MQTYQTEAIMAAREIAHATEQLATAAEEQLTPAVLERLAAHAESIERALAEFRKGREVAEATRRRLARERDHLRKASRPACCGALADPSPRNARIWRCGGAQSLSGDADSRAGNGPSWASVSRGDTRYIERGRARRSLGSFSCAGPCRQALQRAKKTDHVRRNR